MRKPDRKLRGSSLLVGLACWPLGTALAGQPAAYQGEITYRAPLRICRIYSDGSRGPWIAYEQIEGIASCPGRGFDAFEPVLPASNPCGVPLGFPTNGAAKGGIDPFCPIGSETPTCPIQGFRWLFGTFGTYATGSSTHPLNPPDYAVGQDVCELDFLFTENVAAGSIDGNGNVVGNTFIDVVWHSTFNAVPPDCGMQPLVGDIVDGVGLDFGPSTGNGAGGPGFFFTNVVLTNILPPPLPVMPAAGGAYSLYYWNMVPPGPAGSGGVVSGNNQPGGWGFKDAVQQGSSGSVGYQNDDFSLPTDDNGSQIDTATECFDFTSGTLCPQPVIVASLRMGVPIALTNNDCANAFTLAANGTVNGSTVDATLDGSATCGPAAAADVWYRFTALCSGTWTVSTSGANITLSAYTGNCGALTQVACATGTTPSINVAVTGGVTYRVRVATIGGTSGFTVTTSLASVPPSNNDCGAAQAVGEGQHPFSNGCATDDGFLPACASTSTGTSDIWFLYTAGVTGNVTISTCDSNFDTVLSYHGGAGDCFAPELACDDDGCCPGGFGCGSTFMVSVTTGQQLLLRISGFNAAQGSGVLSIAAAVPTVITAANPPAPAGNPYQPGLPYTDVLDTSAGAPTSALTAGIGASGTPGQGAISYAPIQVTFSNPVTFGMADVTIACTRAPCPSVSSVSSSGNTTTIGLSAAIPPLGCTTLTFTGGQKIQYRSRPGDPSLDGSANTGDLLAIVLGINNGMANLPANLGRFNIDRTGGVNTQDLLREVQLLNGTNTTNVFATAGPADACPP